MIEYKDTKEFTASELERLFVSVGWFSGCRPEKLRLAMKNSGCVISAWDGERLVGLVRGMDDGAWQGTVDCLLVDSEYQGRGIASKLLGELLSRYSELLYINVVPDEKKNVPFYLKHGFKLMEEGTPLQIKNSSWKQKEEL